MKYFLIFLVFIFIKNSFASCDQSSKEAVVYVDTNLSHREMDAAKKAACKLGKRFVVIPSDSKAIERISRARENMDYTGNLLANCLRIKGDCSEKEKEHDQYAKDFYDLDRENFPKVDNKIFQEEIQKLADQNIAITSLTISGHNGGSTIDGDIGLVDIYKIQNSLKDVYKNKPDLLEKLNSVHLWGCYTTTAGNAIGWRNSLPGLDVVVGFYGSGPSRDKVGGHNLLEDSIIKSEKLGKTHDKETLYSMIHGLSNIQETFAAILVSNQCNEYYYLNSSDYDEKRIIHQFDDLDSLIDSTCSVSNSLFEELHSRNIEKYFIGELPIPENTTSGPIREIYSFMRQHSNCLEDDYFYGNYTPDSLALLLFYNNVKQNFYDSFKDRVDSLEEDLKTARKFLEDETQALYEKIKPDFDLLKVNNLEDMKKTSIFNDLDSYDAQTIYEIIQKNKNLIYGVSRDKASLIGYFLSKHAENKNLDLDVPYIKKNEELINLMNYYKKRLQREISGKEIRQDEVDLQNKISDKLIPLVDKKISELKTDGVSLSSVINQADIFMNDIESLKDIADPLLKFSQSFNSIAYNNKGIKQFDDLIANPLDLEASIKGSRSDLQEALNRLNFVSDYFYPGKESDVPKFRVSETYWSLEYNLWNLNDQCLPWQEWHERQSPTKPLPINHSCISSLGGDLFED